MGFCFVNRRLFMTMALYDIYGIHYFFLLIIGLGICAGLRLKTHPDHLQLDWAAGSLIPDHWNLVYTVMGTGYHSLVTKNGTETSASISTTDYPGRMYRVQLYAVSNNNKTLTEFAYGRSDCTHNISSIIGETYTMVSTGYPGYQQGGAICSWTYNGNYVTWFKIDLIDIDINNGSKCKNYLLLGQQKICNNRTNSSTMFVTRSTLHWRYVTLTKNGGFKINVTAIHKIDTPTNVSTRITGTAINVSWVEPTHHPVNFDYVVRISNLQQQSIIDIHVPQNRTHYIYNYRSYAGQTFSFEILTASDGLVSDPTDPAIVKTTCDRRLYIKPTETVTMTSSGYPFGYLRGVTCHYTITTNDDFILRLVTSDIDISGGPMCEHAYIRLRDMGQFCSESPPSKEVILQNSSIRMDFLSGNAPRGKGFNVTVSSVAKPPSMPTYLTSKILVESILISWSPPTTKQPYITGYTVEYFILPQTPGGTLHVGPNTRNASINTSDHPGRLYTIRVAAVTGGGQGQFSRTLFARAQCDGKIRLSRMQTSIITTDGILIHGEYQPATICQWNIRTAPPLWLRVDVEELDIELSTNCTKDFLRVTKDRLLCGQINVKTLLVKSTTIDMMFSSDFNGSGTGFRVIVTAVGPAPGTPQRTKVIPTGYSMLVSWDKPAYYSQFVNGYLVKYRFVNDVINYTTRVRQDEYTCVVDMTSYPGSLVEVWIQAIGDMIDSNGSKAADIRNECGNIYNITNTNGVFHLTSPYFNYAHVRNTYCKWRIITDPLRTYEVRFVRMVVNNKGTCQSFLRINGRLTVCNDSIEGTHITVVLVPDITVEMNTIDGDIFKFLLEIRSKPDISDRSSNKESMSSSTYSTCSSSSVALLLTSVVSSFVVSSSWSTTSSIDLNTDEENHTMSSTNDHPYSSLKSSTPDVTHDVSQAHTLIPIDEGKTEPTETAQTSPSLQLWQQTELSVAQTVDSAFTLRLSHHTESFTPFGMQESLRNMDVLYPSMTQVVSTTTLHSSNFLETPLTRTNIEKSETLPRHIPLMLTSKRYSYMFTVQTNDNILMLELERTYNTLDSTSLNSAVINNIAAEPDASTLAVATSSTVLQTNAPEGRDVLNHNLTDKSALEKLQIFPTKVVESCYIYTDIPTSTPSTDKEYHQSYIVTSSDSEPFEADKASSVVPAKESRRTVVQNTRNTGTWLKSTISHSGFLIPRFCLLLLYKV